MERFVDILADQPIEGPVFLDQLTDYKIQEWYVIRALAVVTQVTIPTFISSALSGRGGQWTVEMNWNVQRMMLSLLERNPAIVHSHLDPLRFFCLCTGAEIFEETFEDVWRDEHIPLSVQAPPGFPCTPLPCMVQYLITMPQHTLLPMHRGFILLLKWHSVNFLTRLHKNRLHSSE